MKRKLFTTTALVCCFMICFAAIADVNGKWKGAVNVGGTDYPVTYVFKIDGDKLTGTAQAQGDPKPINDTKINGTEFTFNVTDDNGNPIPHEGKYYADGDSVSMNVTFEGAKLHTTLKRFVEK